MRLEPGRTERDSCRALSVAANLTQVLPSNVLFLTDNVKEVEAAQEAGLQAFMVDRPGNAPLSEDDKGRLRVVSSLHEIDIEKEGSDLVKGSQKRPDVAVEAA